ncbi:hypothetical protein O0L34_g7777 [Tuta absoluta]|nr:hypothetical protein O0L34_g7777 [Tuta absoluta]
MNTSNFLRFMTKTSKFCTNIQPVSVSRVLKPAGCRLLATNVSIEHSKDRETFQDVLPLVVDTLISSPKFSEIPDVANWLKKILEYNLAGGKKARGLTTVFAYEMLETPENITDESMRLARIMGWCVEMLQAYFIVADDMMDGSTTRRGVPCWYRLPDVGLGAINDAILINSSLFEVINKHFRNYPQYADFLDLFNETILLTSAGQHLDFTTAQHLSKKNYSLFTIERYQSIVKYKTAYYTYRLPVSLGLLLANVTDKPTRQRSDEICFDIGEFFQIQDDYIDLYSDESLTGKAGTDIQEGKCSWLAVTALQRCTPAQRALFEQCYASKNPEDVAQIKQLYEQLNLQKLYLEQERVKYEEIVRKIDALSRDTSLSPKLFLKLINMIYNRKR